MSGETSLSKLLSGLTAKLWEETYVFATLQDTQVPTGIKPRMMFREAEGTTLILTEQEAVQFEIPFEFPCRMITLNIHSALEAVGFIAHIATELAKHGMGVNPVAGFYHDHLFVPVGREQDAMKILADIARNHSSN